VGQGEGREQARDQVRPGFKSQACQGEVAFSDDVTAAALSTPVLPRTRSSRHEAVPARQATQAISLCRIKLHEDICNITTVICQYMSIISVNLHGYVISLNLLSLGIAPSYEPTGTCCRA
jgi:hypothetical protein